MRVQHQGACSTTASIELQEDKRWHILRIGFMLRAEAPEGLYVFCMELEVMILEVLAPRT
jgi:hypothetical protein